MANNNYKWEFENIGGSSRVKIRNGEDIARLAELDPKMWTVLSCPVTGLEIDDKSLAYMDCDSDGKIRVNDVIATAQWVTSALKNADLLLEGKDSIDLDQFNQENESGKKLYASAKHILENLGKEGNAISLADTAAPRPPGPPPIITTSPGLILSSPVSPSMLFFSQINCLSNLKSISYLYSHQQLI